MRTRILLAALLSLTTGGARASDVVLDWNAALRQAIQLDRTKPDPGWSARAMAMTNGAMYDALMAIDRTHRPFLADMSVAGDTSKEAAMSAAARQIISAAYPGQTAFFDATFAARMSALPDSQQKSAGIALGESVANVYLLARANDGAGNALPYTPGNDPGQWRPDPMNPAQQAWGPAWGSVETFSMLDSRQFAPPPVPAMTSQEYADSFNEVKAMGALVGSTRTQDQTDTAIFWAYDRPGMGPPPVIFNSHASQIAEQMGNTVEENARMFAMTMIAQADASIAAWDAKFVDNFWRPITAIREAHTDGNPLTEADPAWVPLGAPAGGVTPDFTPPFPAYVSGHATFGAAVFTTLAEFYGTDDVSFELTSDEMPGMVRSFDSFSAAAIENGRSRVYMGVHWNFDDVQGRALGDSIAHWVADRHFAAVPEPSGFLLAVLAAIGCLAGHRRSRRSRCAR